MGLWSGKAWACYGHACHRSNDSSMMMKRYTGWGGAGWYRSITAQLPRSDITHHACMPLKVVDKGIGRFLCVWGGGGVACHKYSGQAPQRLTCKKVPSPSSIREMSTLKLFKWLLMHQKCPQVCISYGKYGPPSPSSKREMSTLKFSTTPAGRTESPLHRFTLYCM